MFFFILTFYIFLLCFFCPLATCERGKHLMSSGGISVWIPCARTGVSDATCGKMKTQQFLPARRVRNRSCKSLLEKMFNPMIWSILFNIYKRVLWTAIFQRTISMAYFQSTNTTWWNRHNFVVFFWAGVGTPALCWSILWMEIYDCALGTIPNLLGEMLEVVVGGWKLMKHRQRFEYDMNHILNICRTSLGNGRRFEN